MHKIKKNAIGKTLIFDFKISDFKQEKMPIDLTHKKIVFNGSKSQSFKKITRLQDLLVCNVIALISKHYDDVFAQHLENLLCLSTDVCFRERKHLDLRKKPYFTDRTTIYQPITIGNRNIMN